MPSEYTPTTDDLGEAWVAYRLDHERFGRENYGRGLELNAEFDRWLAQVKAEAVAAERERCARIVETADVGYVPGPGETAAAVAGVVRRSDLATAIREVPDA